MIVDCAVYEEGRRRPGELRLADAREVARTNGGFAWVGLHDPTAEEFAAVGTAFDLHPLAAEDAVQAHQRPKLERYGDTLFLVLKPARYVDTREVIDVDEIMVFLGADFVVTVRHGQAGSLRAVRHALEAAPDELAWGPSAVLYRVADRVVDDYHEVMASLDDDIDEIEDDVFAGPKPAHVERIFKLKREVLEFRRAVDPLIGPLEQLAAAPAPVDARAAHYFRDVHDHAQRVGDRLQGLDSLLDSALNAYVAQVGMRQNADMRKISGWVALVAVPTMIAAIYGMNFEHMPELGWVAGYPVTLVVMVTASLLLYRVFKHREWL